jgi:hypothetical protein
MLWIILIQTPVVLVGVWFEMFEAPVHICFHFGTCRSQRCQGQRSQESSCSRLSTWIGISAVDGVATPINTEKKGKYFTKEAGWRRWEVDVYLLLHYARPGYGYQHIIHTGSGQPNEPYGRRWFRISIVPKTTLAASTISNLRCMHATYATAIISLFPLIYIFLTILILMS